MTEFGTSGTSFREQEESSNLSLRNISSGDDAESTDPSSKESCDSNKLSSTETGAPDTIKTGAPDSIKTGAPDATKTGALDTTKTGAPDTMAERNIIDNVSRITKRRPIHGPQDSSDTFQPKKLRRPESSSEVVNKTIQMEVEESGELSLPVSLNDPETADPGGDNSQDKSLGVTIDDNCDTALVPFSDIDRTVSPVQKAPGPLNLVGCNNINITFCGSRNEDENVSSMDLGKNEHHTLHQPNIKKYRVNTALPRGSPISMVLMGKTGNGKSATGNTIFWKDQLFESDFGFRSRTQTSKLEHGMVGGRELSVVDTPGNMDPRNKKKILHEIGSAIFLSPDGYDAVILVLKLTRITDEEKEAIVQLKRLFNDHHLLSKHGILLFTGGDQFRKKMSIRDFILDEDDEFIKELLKECQDRVILFNNNVDFEVDEKKSSEQVIMLIEVIDEMVRRKGGEKYSNPYFEQAKDLHSYIEHTDFEQRYVYEMEKEEFEKKLQQKEEEERQKERKLIEERQKDMKMQQDFERERFNMEVQDNIQLERDTKIKIQLLSKLKSTCDKLQKDWIIEVEKITDKYERELNKAVTKDRKSQGVQWGVLLQTEVDIMESELNSIFPTEKDPEGVLQQRKEQFCTNFKNDFQGRKQQSDMQWMKTCKELLNAQSRVLQRQIASKNTVQEDLWMGTFRSQLETYEASFNKETYQIIMKAQSDFNDLVAEKGTLDINWKHCMERLKDQHKLKWSDGPETQISENDLLKVRKEWEKECKTLFDHLSQRVKKDMTNHLDDERQRQETIWTVEIRQRARERLNDLRDEFEEVEKSKNIEQLKKKIQTESFRKERKLSDTWRNRICSVQENKWKEKVTDICSKLNEEDLNTDLSKTVNSYMSEKRQKATDHWKRAVKLSVDETCREFEQMLTPKSEEFRMEMLEKRSEICSKDAREWRDKAKRMCESLLKETEKAISEKLKNDQRKYAKVMDEWKSFEKSWKTVADNEIKSFENTRKAIFSEMSNADDLITKESEIATVRDTLEKKLEKDRIQHEKWWRSEEDHLCQSHLTKLRNEIAVVIEERNMSKKKDLKSVNQTHTKAWRSESKDFMAQKDIYWKTYADGELGELYAEVTKIIEKNMQEQGKEWKEMALNECGQLVTRKEQLLCKQYEKEEKKWGRELQKLRANREWEWIVELKTLKSRWKKEDMNANDKVQKSLKKDLETKWQSMRKQLETEWEERNQQQKETIVSSADHEITEKARKRLEEKLKTFSDRRQTEETKWELNLKKKYLDDQKSKLDKVCKDQFGKTFEEVRICFPGKAKVILKGGKEIQMTKLQNGDYVLCSSQNGEVVYSRVFRFGHRTDQGKHTFVKISTQTNELMMSPNHHVVIGTSPHLQGSTTNFSGTKAAADIQIGEKLLVYDKESEKLHLQAVESVSTVTEYGIYAPYTLSGNIVVDNILASCYVDRVKPQLAHRLLAPARLLYRLTQAARASFWP